MPNEKIKLSVPGESFHEFRKRRGRPPKVNLTTGEPTPSLEKQKEIFDESIRLYEEIHADHIEAVKNPEIVHKHTQISPRYVEEPAPEFPEPEASFAAPLSAQTLRELQAGRDTLERKKGG